MFAPDVLVRAVHNPLNRSDALQFALSHKVSRERIGKELQGMLDDAVCRIRQNQPVTFGRWLLRQPLYDAVFAVSTHPAEPDASILDNLHGYACVCARECIVSKSAGFSLNALADERIAQCLTDTDMSMIALALCVSDASLVKSVVLTSLKVPSRVSVSRAR